MPPDGDASSAALVTSLTGPGDAVIPNDGAGSGVSGAIWGDFAIERKIGSGGMGSVYRARQISLDRIVALKVLPAALGRSERYRQRFAAEAKAAARIHSPQVVTVYTCGDHAGRLWFAMEFIEGMDLALRLRSGWRPDWREALRLGAQAARGLAAAHALGLIHRDIKPSNLMLTTDGLLKIADFGLVHSLDEGDAATGSVVGTLAYMAPEQARGEACDHRVDIYALGCVLYELLCRRRPFDGTTLGAMIDQHLHATPDPPRVHAPWLPGDVEALLRQMLDKDPRRRPDDAVRLAHELERLSHLAPGSRARLPAAVLAVGGMMALLLAVGGWWWLRTAPSATPLSDRSPAPVPAPAPEPGPPEQVGSGPAPVLPVAPHDRAETGPEVAPRPAPPPQASMPERPPRLAAPAPARQPDVASMERAAAQLIATGEHLGPAEELARKLGHPQQVDRQGRSILWMYGRYVFVIQDELVLTVRQR